MNFDRAVLLVGIAAGVVPKPMFFGWPIFIIGIVAGIVLRYKGFAIAFLYETGWWIISDMTGRFTNDSGSGDNLAAEAVLAAVIGFIIAAVGVLIGLTLRALIERMRVR